MSLSLRCSRHLQYGCALARRQPRDQDNLAAGKFERVVMDVRICHIDLAETGQLVLNARLAEQIEGASY